MKAIYLLCSFAAMVLLGACNSGTDKNGNTSADTLTTPLTDPATHDSVGIDMHNAENSLDFNGTYEGTVQSGSVKMKTKLLVNPDKTFDLQETIADSKDNEPFSSKGKWEVRDGSILMLNFDMVADRILQYQIGEGQLTQLDKKGNVPTGTDADKYRLKKTK